MTERGSVSLLSLKPGSERNDRLRWRKEKGRYITGSLNTVSRCLMPALLALPLITGIFAVPACSETAGSRYYVNFADGNDSGSGKSPDAAWKHAPGDPNAEGNPRRIRLGPDDHVVFAPGVVYRGEILVTAQGAEGKPIVFEGGAGNGGPAVIDGSDPVTVAPCRNSAECGDLPDWRNLVLATLDAPLGKGSLFPDVPSGAGTLRVARTPNPADPFYRNEPEDMFEVEGGALQKGRAKLPDGLRGATMAEGARIALWVKGNAVRERPVKSIADGTVSFDPAGLRFYDNRSDRYAIIGIPEALDQEGEYLVLPGGRRIVAKMPAGARTLSVARGRGGFTLEASHIVIRNLTFRNMADNGELFGGRAITAYKVKTRDIRIADNRFLCMDMSRGQGPVTFRRSERIAVSGNRIESVALGRGITIGTSKDSEITGNIISRIGRTGIMLMNVENVHVADNIVYDVKAVHGNGMSAYLSNRHVTFEGNTVLAAKQPVTFKGQKKAFQAGETNDYVFRNNLLVALPGKLGSLIAWGKSTRGAEISGNVLLGGRFGLRMSGDNQGFRVTGNIGVRPALFSGTPKGWSVSGNRWYDGAPPGWAKRIVAASGEAVRTGHVPQTIDCSDLPLPALRTTARIGATVSCARR